MNWAKIKTVLIILFLLIDIFLVIWNVGLKNESRTVDGEVIKNTEELLLSRGINVPQGTLEEGIPDIKRIVVKNALGNEAEFIGEILGKNYRKDGNVFFNSECSVELIGDSFKITEDIKLKNAQDAEKWLTEKGFALKDTIKAEYRGEYVFRSMYKGMEVFGSRISVKSEDSKTVAHGKLYYVVENSETEANVRHATAVLPKLIQEGISNCTVSSVTPGYMVITEDGKFSEAAASPAYRILLADGREIFYNATN